MVAIAQTATRPGPISSGDPGRVLIHLQGWFARLVDERPYPHAIRGLAQALAYPLGQSGASDHWSTIAARFTAVGKERPCR